MTKTKTPAKSKAATAKASPAAKATPAAKAATATREPIATPAPAISALLLHTQIRPDPENPRKDFESDGAKAALQELKASLVTDDLIEPLVVRPAEGATPYMLIAGERRWRAIGLAIVEGSWPADRAIAAQIRDVDEPTARRLALVENLQRRDLNYMEEARSLQQLVELEGKAAGVIGVELGFTDRWAQQRVQLLSLSPKMQQRLEVGLLKLEEARTVVAMWDQLPRPKQLGLENGERVTDVKAWHDQQPKPLSDKAKLVLAELVEAIKTRPVGAHDKDATEVQARTERQERNGYTHVTAKIDDAAFAELRKRHIVDDPRQVREEGVETGRHTARLAYYYGENEAKKELPGVLDAKKRPAILAELRERVVGKKAKDLKAGEFATTWLNGPFETDPAVVPEIETKRAARLEREAEIERQDQERKAAEKAAKDRQRARLKAIGTGEPKVREAAGQAVAAAIGELAGGADLALPLYLKDNGDIVDGAGKLLDVYTYTTRPPEQLAQRRALVAIVNAAAGLETPAKEPKPPAAAAEILPRAEFVRVVADLIVDDLEGPPEDEAEALFEATAIAGRALDAFLASQAIEYGAADYDWADEGADQLAQLIRDEDLGREPAPAAEAQIDLEEAIAAAPEADSGDARATFVDSVADELLGEDWPSIALDDPERIKARAKVEAALAGITYGAGGHDWTGTGATALARAIEATECAGVDADEVELSPALLALAGGTAKPIAGPELEAAE